MLTSGAPDQK